MDNCAAAAIVVLPLLLSACGAATPAAESPTTEVSSTAQAEAPVVKATSDAREESERPPPEAADATSRSAVADADEASEPQPQILPTTCAGTEGRCAPPDDFVERLCQDKYPGVAIAMFEKSTPWTRLYVRMAEIDSVNTTGGPAADAKLVFAEELLLLREHGSGNGGFQVSGAGGYLVLRWDGTCATVSSDEVVEYYPGFPKAAPIVWKYIDSDLRDALLADSHIKLARQTYMHQCRGMRPGMEAGPCKHATQVLNDSVVLAVRKGIDLPPPDRIP